MMIMELQQSNNKQQHFKKNKFFRNRSNKMAIFMRILIRMSRSEIRRVRVEDRVEEIVRERKGAGRVGVLIV
jgi:hypothetical protein